MGEETLGGTFGCGIFNLLACNSTTKGSIGKQRPWINSAHLQGPEIPFHGTLIVVVGCCTGGAWWRIPQWNLDP